jgi:hypothetical protein
VEGPRLGDRASGPEALHWGETRIYCRALRGSAPLPGLEMGGGAHPLQCPMEGPPLGDRKVTLGDLSAGSIRNKSHALGFMPG